MMDPNQAIGVLRRERDVARAAGDERAVAALTLAMDSIDTIQLLLSDVKHHEALATFNLRKSDRGD